MAYIGRDIQYGTLDKQSFTANSSTTAFTLNSSVKDAKSLLVSVGGVIQEPEVAYTASGTTLTFSEAPATGNVVYVVYLGKELTSGAARENITYQTGTGNNSTTPLTLSSAPPNASALMVMLNGVTQRPVTDYTVSGTTLTFTTAVATGVNILVYHLGRTAEIGVINDNAVTDAKIVSMNAAKLTGQLPGSMAADTTKIDQSIATLGLHIGVADNKASYNLPSAFIDTFEDDSGILTETTADRDATGEYVSTSYTSTTETSIAASDWSGGISGYTLTTGGADQTASNYGIYTDKTFSGDFTFQADNSWTGGSTGMVGIFDNAEVGSFASSATDRGGLNNMTVSYWADSWYPGGNGNEAFYGGSNVGSTYPATSGFDGNPRTVKLERVGTTIKIYTDDTLRHTYSQTSSVTFRGAIGGQDASTNMQNIKWTESTTVNNATGTLISKAQTADAAVSSTSGVMLYEDSEGTGTLGTDLKVYFSSNDGTNWTEAASYGTPQSFVGSTKMVKLGKTTIANTGTAVKMKAEWANQAAGVAAGKYAVTAGMLSQTGLSSFSAAQVVDGDVATGGGGKGFYVGSGTSSGEMVVDLGVGNPQTFNKIRSYTSIATNSAVWTIAYSDNGSAWTNTSLTNFAPGSGSFNAWFEGTWTDVGAHRYWKMFISSGNGGSQGWVGHEIEWHAAAVTGKVQRLHGWAVNY